MDGDTTNLLYDLFGSNLDEDEQYEDPPAVDDENEDIQEHANLDTHPEEEEEIEQGPSNIDVNLEEEEEVEHVNSNPEEVEQVDGPRTGMRYDSFESIFQDYQEYARKSGFSVLKRALSKGKYAHMACDKSRVPSTQKISKRVGCPAHLNAIKQEDESWIISKIVTTHNHDLDPSMSILMPAHRKLSVHMKRLLEANDIAGIRPSKNIRLCEVQAGGPDKIGCLPKDCRNFIESRRRLRLGDGDAEAIRKLFATLQHRDGNFFYVIDIDDEGRIRNVLWIHPRRRAAYEDFNDVVSFDTTYLVNKYEMPFGAFVGINHHGQSILLGCALVMREDSASFKWLFENWLQAMGDVQPRAILTDQCESIGNTIRDVLPDTTHRYCLWHIMSKLPIKFKGLQGYDTALVEFKGIVYDSITIPNFERDWAEFLVKYGLENKAWLQNLYTEREKWVPVYLNNIFWAGMISTQRSEGMHAYFDDYIHSRCTLKEFMEQYEVAISKKIQKEFMADYDSKMEVKKCKTDFPWERQFQKVYTNAIFGKDQEEIDRMMYCNIVPAPKVDVVSVGTENFYVMERSLRNNFFVKEFTYKVEYRSDGESLNCECKRFEFKGIICCHLFKVMILKDIQAINERYILNRWRKDVRRRHSSIYFEGGYPHMTDEYKKFPQVEKYFQECVDATMDNPQKMDFLKVYDLYLEANKKNEHSHCRPFRLNRQCQCWYGSC